MAVVKWIIKDNSILGGELFVGKFKKEISSHEPPCLQFFSASNVSGTAGLTHKKWYIDNSRSEHFN